MCNLTSEAWIFWHLFFTLGTAAVIAFEGSLIHLRRTLPSLSRKHDWYLTHVLFSSLLMSQPSLWLCLFVWGAHTAFQFGALLRDGRLISETAFYFPSCVCGSFFFLTFDLLVCATRCHQCDSVFLFVCFLKRFKSWNSVMMKGPFKEAQVGWEQWQSERQIQRKELTS